MPELPKIAEIEKQMLLQFYFQFGFFGNFGDFGNCFTPA